MIRLVRFVFAAFLIAAPGTALAQSTLLQGGSWATGRAPMYVGQGNGTGQVIVQDSGPASGGGPGVGLSELNITARGTGTAPYAGQGTGPNGEVACLFDAPSTNATGYHSLCFSANVSSGGLISYQANGAASAFPLNFKVNGTTYEFPFTTSGVVGPASSTIDNAACWNNTSGTLLKDCGPFVTVAGNNTWSGTNNFTSTFQIGGVTQTFPASGALVGTSDAQSLTNKSIGASQINSGTLSATVMPAFTGDVTTSAGAVATTIANGVVSNAKLATAATNTIKGNPTSGTAAVQDMAVPSCSGAANALQWTTDTGFGCGTLGATTAGWGVTLSGGGVFSISTSAPPFSYDLPINMGLTASVNASALTINLRTAAGNAPSATDPVLIPFRSTTLATGTASWTAITGALSIVVPSAATLGTSNNVPFRIWIFATYNSGTPQLGVAICTVAPTLYPCAAWEVARKTTVAIDGFSTSAGVLYATGAVTNDSIRIIGYADYASGLATAGAWASVPTTLQVMGPGVPKPGEIIQTVSTFTGSLATGSTTMPYDNTIPQISEGNEYMTLAITPTAAVNILDVHTQGIWSIATATSNISAALFNTDLDATNALAAAATVPRSTAETIVLGFNYVVRAPTTSATTFRVRAGGASGNTVSFNGQTGTILFGGVSNSFIRIKEIMSFDLKMPANDNANPGVYSMTG